MFGFIIRLAVIVSIPVISLTRKANAGVVQTAVSQYPHELILVLCGVMMSAGALASIVTPDPEGVKPTKPMPKLIYSFFGSVSALTYLVFYEKDLSLVHALWVGGVSFVSPVAIPSLKALVFELMPIAMQTLKNFIGKWIGQSKGNGNG